jgi:hypothetical protein
MSLDVDAVRPGRRPGFAWTPQLIGYAVDLWHRRYLRLPTAAEWERAGVDHPSRRTVTRAFGSWNAALAAAGFQPRRPGQNLRWELRRYSWQRGPESS